MKSMEVTHNFKSEPTKDHCSSMLLVFFIKICIIGINWLKISEEMLNYSLWCSCNLNMRSIWLQTKQQLEIQKNILVTAAILNRDHARFGCYRGQCLKVNVYDGWRTPSDGKCSPFDHVRICFLKHWILWRNGEYVILMKFELAFLVQMRSFNIL